MLRVFRLLLQLLEVASVRPKHLQKVVGHMGKEVGKRVILLVIVSWNYSGNDFTCAIHFVLLTSLYNEIIFVVLCWLDAILL